MTLEPIYDVGCLVLAHNRGEWRAAARLPPVGAFMEAARLALMAPETPIVVVAAVQWAPDFAWRDDVGVTL